MKKHVCPHCGEPAFTPIQKALAGSLRTNGKPCPNCGRKCCNGMSSIYFSTTTGIIALIVIIAAYIQCTDKMVSTIIIIASILISLLLNFLYDMFFGKLTEPIRIMQ
ncbi:MAG: hypothetical protein E7502_02890 [Ruminococcus sp.]|jgi:Fe-S-cluster containining protein|nr:hypothetical protein [Ruminococcus sp.]